MYDTYSVGGFTKTGREIGGERRTREAADELFDLVREENAASIVLYGWTAEGECDELKSWSL